MQIISTRLTLNLLDVGKICSRLNKTGNKLPERYLQLRAQFEAAKCAYFLPIWRHVCSPRPLHMISATVGAHLKHTPPPRARALLMRGASPGPNRCRFARRTNRLPALRWVCVWCVRCLRATKNQPCETSSNHKQPWKHMEDINVHVNTLK